LNDYNIPLLLRHTVTDIRGKNRLESVVVSEIDTCGCPIPGTEKEYICDTLLLSVGLLPEIELPYAAGIVLDPRTRGPRVNESMETSLPGIFACGNVAHVHDLVDYVTLESQKAGRYAARYIRDLSDDRPGFPTVAGEGIGYIVPQEIRPGNCDDMLELYFRVKHVYKICKLVLRIDDKVVKSYQKKHLTPGEMQHLRIPHEMFCRASSLGLDIEA
ncbi:MAG: NAD(P)/FAD-dependent oxidoreductase, partial [FCB group bacterium]|nr:NAD(P)/FAD-dependent oxidoreductase [FCB group bacterium]